MCGVKKRICIVLVMVLVLTLVGCNQYDDLQGGKKNKAFKLIYNGVTYDFSMDLPELIGKFEENDVYVYSALRMEQLGKKGVYKQSSGLSANIEKAMAAVLVKSFVETLPDDLEENRIMYARAKIMIPVLENYPYSFGNDISSEFRELSEYFNLDADRYHETINNLNSADTAAEAFRTLDKSCTAEGFVYSSFWKTGCIAAVYFDGEQVDLGKYAVADVKDFMEYSKKEGLAPMDEAIQRLWSIKIKLGIDISGIQEFEELIDCLSEAQIMNLEREMAINKATYEGIEKVKAGDIHSVYVVRVDEIGTLHIEMYRKNGKVLMFTSEDEECNYTWQ